ncbi:fatty acid synthase-like, partial [Pseudomyrmex gracilis]|uniref:fatty acid synthase-like n=1 Tax=Pseudomyrmex gracilis TaxID=219809 RepID=UPI0009959587
MIENPKTELPVQICKNIDLIVSGGVQIWGVKATSITRRQINADPVIEEHRFVAHQDREKISLHEAIRISTQIALEDHQITKVKAIELVEDADIVSTEELAIPAIIEACNNLPLVQASVTLMTSLTRFNASDLPPNVTIADLKKHVDTKVLMVIGFNLLSKRRSLEQLLLFLEEGGYLLSREKHDVTEVTESYQQYGLNVILEKRTEKEIIVLLKKRITIKETTVVYINNNNFEWVENLKLFIDEKETFNQNKRIVIVSESDFECGLLGFVNCLRKEPGGELVRGVFIQDKTAPKFSLQDPFYAQQLQKDMTVNILRPNKTWGSYRHFCLPAPEPAFVPAAYVCQTDRGNLSTFCWIENDISIDSHCNDLVRVVYSSINFRDVMLATGKLTTLGIEERFESMSLGLEYVGFDAKGQRVMGVRNNKYWGAIGDVGLVADMQENDKKLVIGGTLQQGILSCLNELDKFLLQNRPIVSSMVVAEKKQRASESNISETVAAIMNIKDIKKLSQTTSLAELGIDSMMAVEIRQTMERDFNVYLSLQEIRSLTFAKLFDISNTKAIVEETSEKATSDKIIEQNIFGIVQNKDFISEIFVDLSPKNKESATQVFLIPGFDGCGTIFNHLEMYIKFTATSLHYNTGVISACNTLSKMVEILEQ